MKEEKLSAIADRLGVSKSTVSKALRHCSGVDTDMRQRILTEAAALHAAMPSDACPIYCILPDRPYYFWHEMRRGIRAGEDASVASMKYNIITRVGDTDTVLLYLDEAERLGARAILIAATMTDALRARLQSFLPHTCVILLSEYDALSNTFYVGADPHADGMRMGALYAEQYRTRTPILLDLVDDSHTDAKLSGFRRVLAECVPAMAETARTVLLPRAVFQDARLLPSRLAAYLSEAAAGLDSVCIYSPFGLMPLPLAVGKAGLRDRAVTLCHDNFFENDCLPDGMHAVLRQDVYGQGRQAAVLAADFIRSRRFPMQKRSFIPSRLLTGSTI